MMREIHIHGALGAKYGRRFDFDVANVAQAVRALSVQIPGFHEDLRKWNYRVIRRDGRHNMDLGEADLCFKLGKARQLHFVPILRGAKDRGVGKIILGVVLAGAAIAISPGTSGGGFLRNLGRSAFRGGFGALGTLGGSLILGGVAQLLSPTPEIDNYGASGQGQTPSFLFSGPVNVATQGVAIPVVYGRFRVGSVTVSAELTTEEIPV